MKLGSGPTPRYNYHTAGLIERFIVYIHTMAHLAEPTLVQLNLTLYNQAKIYHYNTSHRGQDCA